MRSIIDEIAEAEAKAAQIRQDGASSARDMIAAAQQRADESAAALEEDGRAKLRAALEEAEKKGEALAADVGTQKDAASKTLCREAEARIPGAVDHIMKSFGGAV